mmetsp:Transcript_124649/g.364027  ORF Transcript_124649/g.364027 Transcript_124649/m.364027 type:complete len:318 (+) Transcript_124649:522-1475(+)
MHAAHGPEEVGLEHVFGLLDGNHLDCPDHQHPRVVHEHVQAARALPDLLKSRTHGVRRLHVHAEGHHAWGPTRIRLRPQLRGEPLRPARGREDQVALACQQLCGSLAEASRCTCYECHSSRWRRLGRSSRLKVCLHMLLCLSIQLLQRHLREAPLAGGGLADLCLEILTRAREECEVRGIERPVQHLFSAREESRGGAQHLVELTLEVPVAVWRTKLHWATARCRHCAGVCNQFQGWRGCGPMQFGKRNRDELWTSFAIAAGAADQLADDIKPALACSTWMSKGFPNLLVKQPIRGVAVHTGGAAIASGGLNRGHGS